jgi:hypothetical protein
MYLEEIGIGLAIVLLLFGALCVTVAIIGGKHE